MLYVRGKGLLAGIPFLAKSYTCSVRNKFRPEIYNIKQLKSVMKNKRNIHKGNE